MSDSDTAGPGVPHLSPISSPEPPNTSTTDTKPSKRKRSPSTADPSTNTKPPNADKKKRRKLKKPADITETTIDTTLGVNNAIAHMDPALLADHLAQRTRRFHPQGTVVEWEERHIPQTAIVDTTTWHTTRTAANLPAFLDHFARPRRGGPQTKRQLSDAPKAKGTPHTLVLAGSGQRAADLTRALKPFATQDAGVAKLFAKHIKLAEAKDMCAARRMCIGVGTPRRVGDLMESGALGCRSLERVVVDASFVDAKKRGLLDMADTQVPLVEVLGRGELRGRYGGEVDEGRRLEVLFF